VLGNRLFLFFTPWTRLNIFKRLDDYCLLPASFIPLGSVGLSAVAISMLLTRGVVITAGIDFSFTMDSFHARSTPSHLARLRRQNRFTGLLNADALCGQLTFQTVSKTGGLVFSNPAMRGYRELFEKEFGGSPRLFDLPGSGLPLGVKTLSMEEAFALLTGGGQMVIKGNSASGLPGAEKLSRFVQAESDRLTLLRDILTGSVPMDYGKLAMLIDECDYLWAHFPDYAASSRRPDKAELEAGGQTALSFLNRVRAEIEPFLKLWDMAVKP
jgi:hypothetical protein